MGIIKYGLLGAGMMGQEHINNVSLLKDASITAFVEPDPAMRDTAQCMLPDAKCLSSLKALLQEEIDALIIATPNYQHMDQLLEVMSTKHLPILIEKPIATSLEQVNKLKNAAKHYTAPIWVAMEYRYMPPIMYLREQLAQGITGSVSMLSIREHRFPFLEKVENWNRFNDNTGGTLVEKCCHFFDLMRLILGAEVKQVYASAAQDCNHLDERYGGKQPDIIDNAYVILDFANGKRALLDLNMFAEGSRYQEEICVVGQQAKLECFIPGPGRFWPTEKLGPAPIPKVIHSPRKPQGPIEHEVPVDPQLLAAGDHNGSTYYQHSNFFDVITAGKPVEVTLADGLKSVVLGLAAQHSAQTGKAVQITEDGYSYDINE